MNGTKQTTIINHMAQAAAALMSAFPGLGGWRHEIEAPEKLPEAVDYRTNRRHKKASRLRFRGWKPRPERAAFIEAHNRNAMNFLPGAICHGIYAVEDRQSDVEARARKVLERSPDLLRAAKARGYTG